MGTGDRDGGERSREDEAWSVRPNHVDELGGTGNITTNCAVCFTKGAYKSCKRVDACISMTIEPEMMSTRSMTVPGMGSTD